MATETVEISEAQAHLKELVDRVAGGVHVLLSQDQKPVALLVPLTERTPGLHAGTMWTSEDFDAPLPDAFWTGDSK